MSNLTETQKANTTENQVVKFEYFRISNDYIGYMESTFYSYLDAVNTLHDRLQETGLGWIMKDHPKSIWTVEQITIKGKKSIIDEYKTNFAMSFEDEKQVVKKYSTVYRISSNKAKKLIINF